MKKSASRKRAPRISAPPHPHRRREPLPHEVPKSERLDADAPRRIQAILDSPSYLPAENDSAFLDLGDNRGVRLQIEYQKPEHVLQRHGIQHTIVVFGSTRITERAAAESRVAELERRLARHPRDRDWRRAIDIDFLVDEGTVDAEDRELFWYAETAEEIWEGILRWHETNGTPLLRA